MIDTHTHLYSEDYGEDCEGAVQRALDAGVTFMVLPGVDMSTLAPMLQLHKGFPDQTSVAIGLHPTELGDDWKESLDKMEEMLRNDSSSYSAIGETGIDLHWDSSNLENQKEAFSRQYDWAVKYDLPLIIHCREGFDETLEVISSKEGKRPKMIFHSFTAGPEEVRRVREICDPWFGINGVVTFKNAGSVREAVSEIGIVRIVLETDSPYLAPVPYRGQRNESSYLPAIANKVAEVLGLAPEDVERITDRNAREIFPMIP